MRWTSLRARPAHPGEGRARYAGRGRPEQECLQDYPDLEAADIRACLAYAARYFDHPVLVNG